jgi:outer membrane protein assembly factor BamD (BamD/ComL family)
MTVCALALCAAAFPAQAGRPARAQAVPSTPAAADVSTMVSQSLALSQESMDPRRLALTRAAFEHARGDFAAVAAALEPLALESSPPFPDADRAAFLLGHAWLKLGQRARFSALAHAVAGWPAATAFTRWLAFEQRLGGDLDGAAAGAERTGQTAADALAADQLLRDDNAEAVLTLLPAGATSHPLLLQLRAAALARLGRDDTAELEALAANDSGSVLARDLAGAALVRLATRAAEHGEDPRPRLALVPPGSRYAARAQHLIALVTLERGDATSGREQLECLLAGDSAYAGRREVAQRLAGQALDEGRWDDALSHYSQADADWQHEREALRELLVPSAAATLWQAWTHDHSESDALVLDGLPAEALTEQLALAAADLTSAPPTAEPALGVPAPDSTRGPSVPPPSNEDWDRVAASAYALGGARGALALAIDSLERERTRLADQRRYYGYGLDEVRGERDGLSRRSALLDSLHAAMDQTAQRLIRLRDAATLRFQRRAASVLARAEGQTRWIQAMKHFYLDGPDGARQSRTPAMLKGPDVVLQQEFELVQSLHYSAGLMQAATPRRIAAAYEKLWGPRLIDRANSLATGTHEAWVWARTLSLSVDSALASVRTSPAEARLGPLADALARQARQLAGVDAGLREEIAHAAVSRALTTLQAEREGLDYGLAASSYARSVRLSAADTLPVAAVVRGAQGADDEARQAASDSLSRVYRADAIARASIFLVDHPDSPARGEMRFRLADVLVTEARTGFRDRMAGWLRAQSAGGSAPLPVVDHAQALTLYRHLLAEDLDFPHRDAVLFNAGMLLADTGDPAAGDYFTRLLTEFPASAYVQEASLRLGDLAFDAQDLTAGVKHYQRAATGPDPSLQAIALYKTGWAHYNVDRFEAAAVAFRGVLDLYASDASVHVQAEIEHEAEQYFVYSLAAAGGAQAFERAFPAGPERPYERRVLRAMGQHFRRYGELGNATQADELYLQRWPSDPAALDVAGRLAETQSRAERPNEERATRLHWAEQFAPGGAWAQAQSSDSLRAAGAGFARSAWHDVALESHRKARQTGSRDEWRTALTHYQTLLTRWPGDSSAATYHLYSGEACAELGEFAAALQHYRTAAATGRDSIRVRAAWQTVAVTDRWYESTRPAPVRGVARAAGSDSLALAVMAAADQFIEQDPHHPQAADLVWRECQLALAHGWSDVTLIQLARFTRDYPSDKRAPLAAGERAETYFRRGDFGPAGDAFEEALVIARRAGADSLVRRAEKALPVCAFREAEAAVAQDSTRHERHAELFEEVAKRWPGYEYATVAQYRAGLAWLAAGHTQDGVRALESLAERWPAHALTRDANLKCAQAWEAVNDHERASRAYLEFSQKHPADASADEAWLKAADLCDSAGLGTRADDLRAQYLKRWPADQETALEILEKLAHQELARLTPERTLASLLVTPKPGVKGAASAPVSYLAQYLKRAAQKPSLASKPLLAEVRYRFGEEAFQRYGALRLTQPLAKSIAAKQRLLDSVLVRYRRTVDMGVAEWAHAATYRIGETLVGFGEALEQSERPADLLGDDLKAYENVLMEQSVTFHERGETVWTDLLKRTHGSVADAWTTRAQGALWSRLGSRFLFQPEHDFPLVEASGPGRSRAPRPSHDTTAHERGALLPVPPIASEDHN